MSAAEEASTFADGPARDPRFVVADRWSECTNLSPDHPDQKTEFFHRQMNEEIDSLECSAVTLVDFPEADWDLRMSLARQCWDEARHAVMFRRVFESRGGKVGQYPVLNFQYRIIANIDSLVGRLSVQNRSFEAGGLDAIAVAIEDSRSHGLDDEVQLFEAQYADEISHVRFANAAIMAATEKDALNTMKIGAALAQASKGVFEVMGDEGTSGVSYPADVNGRLEAGFSNSEIEFASELQN